MRKEKVVARTENFRKFYTTYTHTLTLTHTGVLQIFYIQHHPMEEQNIVKLISHCFTIL